MTTTYYVRPAGSGGDDTNDGLAAAVGGGHGPFLTPIPACVGGAHEASSGDTINCRAVQTIDLGSARIIAPAGVQLIGNNPCTRATADTIITSTASLSGGPIVQFGDGASMSNIRVQAPIVGGKPHGSAFAFGAYYSETLVVGVPTVGTNSVPGASFTVTDCDMNMDTDGLYFRCDNVIGGAYGVVPPTITANFIRVSGFSLFDTLQTSCTYNDGLVAAKGIFWGGLTINLTNCEFLPVWDVSGALNTAKTCRALNNTACTVNVYGGTFSATDATNDASVGQTLGISASGVGVTNVFGAVATGTRPNGAAAAFDLRQATTGKLVAVGATYSTHSGTIIDVSVFPAPENVALASGAFGPTGADYTPSLALIVAGSPLFPIVSGIASAPA